MGKRERKGATSLCGLTSDATCTCEASPDRACPRCAPSVYALFGAKPRSKGLET